MGRNAFTHSSQDGGSNLCWIGPLGEREKMQRAMPGMGSLLDSARHLLEELSPRPSFTDPVYGTMIHKV